MLCFLVRAKIKAIFIQKEKIIIFGISGIFKVVVFAAIHSLNSPDILSDAFRSSKNHVQV